MSRRIEAFDEVGHMTSCMIATEMSILRCWRWSGVIRILKNGRTRPTITETIALIHFVRQFRLLQLLLLLKLLLLLLLLPSFILLFPISIYTEEKILVSIQKKIPETFPKILLTRFT